MDAQIGWLDRPNKKLGLDNLGTQQPCVAIYTNLLPGITNVTDRAAYFGFYPWFVRVFEQRYEDAPDKLFRDKLRRADCLMTMIAERHAIATDGDIAEHSAACPGRLKLGPAAHQLSQGGTVDLGVFADRTEGNPHRYFKNPLGGLGQYYLGPLRDQHQVLWGDPRTGVRYIHETAGPLAEAYGEGVDEDGFFRALEASTLTAADLDRLAMFCPCSLHSGSRPKALKALTNLFFHDASPGGLARRSALGLLLTYLHNRDGAAADDPVKAFLAGCYTGALPEGPWAVNESYEAARRGWALYLRNEMLSLAWSAIFKNALDALDGLPKPFSSIDDLARWVIATEAFAYRPAHGFDGLLEADIASAPALEDGEHPDHELTLWRALLAYNPPPVEAAVRLLVRLVARQGLEERDVYRDAGLPPGSLAGYPLTLNSLPVLARRWAGLSAEAWLQSLVCEALVTHQRIAIRKMGQSGEDTLMFRSGDLGFFVHRELDEIVETQPRLRQALQILRDLGLIVREPAQLPRLTEAGFAQLSGLSA